VRGDSHSTRGLRFRLENIDGQSGVVPVVYRGEDPPPLFKVGRSVVASGSFAGGRLNATDILTKCPSKYTATTSTAK
jgi:cytochrome c-type biogenesis protein CcmE